MKWYNLFEIVWAGHHIEKEKTIDDYVGQGKNANKFLNSSHIVIVSFVAVANIEITGIAAFAISELIVGLTFGDEFK